MNAFRLTLLTLLFSSFFGAIYAEDNVGFSEAQLVKYKKAAIVAASDQSVWVKLKAKRRTEFPKFDVAGIEYEIPIEHQELIKLLIPSGGKVGYHSTYVEIVINRQTLEPISLNESFWP